VQVKFIPPGLDTSSPDQQRNSEEITANPISGSGANSRGNASRKSADTNKAVDLKCDRLLKVDVVAERLGICKRGVNRLISRGDLPVVKIMRSTRISETDLVNYINQQKKGGNS
jgi:excisionase family DNA binding protein